MLEIGYNRIKSIKRENSMSEGKDKRYVSRVLDPQNALETS